MKAKNLLIAVGFLLFVLLAQKSYATHIRAGEITAELVNCQSFSYIFTVTGYTDTGSSVEFGGGEINFGDGRIFQFNTEDFDEKRELGNEIEINIFTVEHTFPGPGEYIVTFREFNRNAGVVNMDNSVNTPFYIETKVIIDPILGCNNTPILTIPPVDGACTGTAFIHNPGAYDPDGDSLSYSIVIPKQDRDLPVNNYRFPNNAEFGGTTELGDVPTTFTLDPITGDLVWDAPGLAGEYNMAFIVEEWRLINGQWESLGYVTRDMQVIVEDCENNPPELTIPNDTCIVAGTLLEAEIIGDDPDGDQVKLETFGSVYSLDFSPATFQPDPPEFQDVPNSLAFSWQTNCNHVRNNPYAVRFKATDDGGPQLAEFATWNVTVVGPPPEGLTAEVNSSRSILLNWDEYECGNAEQMQVWRRVGSNDFTPDHCEIGMPANAGYELVATVDISENSFVDDNEGLGLSFGADFCYRLVAVFPGGGESFVSNEACAYIEASAPVITNVSVDETDNANGQIFVRWTSPFEIDSAEFPPPYEYEVFRANGFAGASGLTQVSSGRIQDTSFVDTNGLDTRDNVYNYRIYLYDGNGNFVDSSAVASSVHLALSPLVGAIELSWEAEVPWSNNDPEFPYHYIYRDQVDPSNPSELVLIDSVNVGNGSFLYLDDGSFNGQTLNENQEYCYYVEALGSYGNEKILQPLVNLSQIACAQPNDTVPPCIPVALTFGDFNSPDQCLEYIQNQSCNFTDFSNELTWTADEAGECDQDIRGYNVYYSRSGDEGTYERITFVQQTSFIHENLNSFAGCYRISAVDRSGNESELSDPICKDNCPYYELPNVFTPNDDGTNDTFRALYRPFENICPRFVESVNFRVYNRWGVEIFNSEEGGAFEQSIFIDWTGQTNDGTQVSPGVYYYVAEITYTRLNPEDEQQEIKGYVQVLK